MMKKEEGGEGREGFMIQSINTSSVKHSKDSVVARAVMAASGTGSLVFIENGTAVLEVAIKSTQSLDFDEHFKFIVVVYRGKITRLLSYVTIPILMVPAEYVAVKISNMISFFFF